MEKHTIEISRTENICLTIQPLSQVVPNKSPCALTIELVILYV